MVGKCANSWCPATRHHHEGKLFRVDIDLSNKSGENEYKTDYIWLCSRCAQEMHPTVEVVGNTIKVRLSKNDPMRVADADVLAARVN
jgi:hypothetical protein